MRHIIFIFSLFLIFSCKSTSDLSSKVDGKSDTADSEWIYLFDGTSLDGWRNYNSQELSAQWVIKDGELTFDTEKRLEADKRGGGDLIYGKEEFDNFELYLEWKIPEGGNSGVFYHLKEGYGGPPEVSPEYQLLDDLKWEEINNAKLADWQKTGADYAMYSADESIKKVKPAGEWNTTRIIFTPEKATYFLNGQKTVEFVPWSEDWQERKMKGKWKNVKDYGKYKTGYIGLQDHDSPIWFREIKIKKL
ncbi:3-keto-disaccharide hydrolase [Portibacter lacus]|uniref:Glycosyl hydrolase n=1 Tax=Portibacter lacus TaxID=1099794 RepID=A0AA37WFN7_9BACT|nr:DUF1080 domain-containing protein [Portibacter lacus]GLR17040.1 glycosyl hydrolase [Portibacter lacus]